MNILELCTVATGHLLAHTRCLVASFLACHPQGRAIVLALQPDLSLDIASERCSVVPLDDLHLPHLCARAFRYGADGLRQVIKPFFLDYLLASAGDKRSACVTPSVLVYSPMSELERALETSSVVLFPNLLSPVAGQLSATLPEAPNLREGGTWQAAGEGGTLASGVYSAGMLGISPGAASGGFLRWWQDSVFDADRSPQCRLDKAPALFDRVAVLRHPGYNVPYWSLHERALQATQTGYDVNGEALRCVSFDGLALDAVRRTSAGQGAAESLSHAYQTLLFSRGYRQARATRDPYAVFDDGVSIPPITRAIFAAYDPDGVRWPDPFSTQGAGSVVSWLNEPCDQTGAEYILITRLAYEVYRRRSDLQHTFPAVLGRDREDYARWFVHGAPGELDLAACFIEPMAASLPEPAERRWWNLEREPAAARRGLFDDPAIDAGPGGLPFLPARALPTLSEDGEPAHAVIPVVPMAPRSASKPAQAHTPGANIIGYLRSESGVGEVSRSMMRTLLSHGYPAACTTLQRHDGARQADDSLKDWPAGHPFDANIMYVNADGVPVVVSDLGRDFFAGKYNIGCWFWELSSFPKRWHDRFSYFQEIWAGSGFVQTAIAAVSPLPGAHVRPLIEIGAVSRLKRADFGVPEGAFAFLYVFDILNGCERKNPFGLLDAYGRAFDSGATQAVLVLKINNLDRAPERERLLREARAARAIVIDRYLSRADLYALMKACDAYVSLHRAEGFGLTIAEAMLLGKPVIATAYSGNMDFTTPGNSYLAKYRLTELDHDYPPYEKGNVWASPDLDHAASLMRRVFEQRAEAAALADEGMHDVQRMYGSAAAWSDVRMRLDLIVRAQYGY